MGPIRFTVDDGLATITLNRPERLNAFDQATAHAWRDATGQATSREDVGAILIRANGPAFCAGGDVMAMADGSTTGDDLEALAHVINEGIRALTESSVPVVAAAHGTTAGGGLGILLASDLAVVGTDSRIGSRYANVGLTPDLSVTAQLTAAVGQRRALQLLLSDRMLTSAEAVNWGLAAEVVGTDGQTPHDLADAVRARSEEIARSWLGGASWALGQAKRLVRSQAGRTMPEQLDEEARTIAAAFNTPVAKARIAAFTRRNT